MKNRAETKTKTPPIRFAKLAVAAVAIAAYLNILPNDYCYDDIPIVRDSALVNEPGKALTIWTSDYWGESVTAWKHRDLLYRPATGASFRIVRTIFGPSPWPQHVVNILLHALVTLLIVRVGLSLKLPVPISIAAAMLFAVLPIHVEAVAPIVGRADLLAAAATLCAFLAHAKSIRYPRNLRFFQQSVCVVSVLIAMTAKESAAAIIPILALYDFMVRPSLQPLNPSTPSLAPYNSNLRHWLQSTIYLLIPLFAYLTLRYIALDGVLFQQPAPTKTVNTLIDSPPNQRFLGVFQLFGMYWLRTIWPQTLCISYSINAVRPATSLIDPTVLVGLGVFVGLIVWSVISWHHGRRNVALLIAFLFLAYLPTSNALVLIQVFFAERIWYLPSIAACLLIALAIGPLLSKAPFRILGFVILAAMFARGWFRSAEWRDDGRLYASCYRDHPDSIACLNLYGGWLTDHGRIKDGIALLHRAVEMDLGFTDAHRALGRAYLQHGDLERAVNHLQTADMQTPHHAPTVESLTRAVEQLRTRHADRLSELERTAKANPTSVEAELAYIRVLREVGLVAEALDRFKSRETVFASAATWHYECAVTLVLLDQRDAAIEHYRKTLKLLNPSTLEPLNPSTLEPLNPPSPAPYLATGDQGRSICTSATVELAMLLLERRAPSDIDDAGRLCRDAIALDPANPGGHICQAEHLALTGDLAAAAAAFNRAIALLPAESPQRRILEQRAKSIGR